jgi:hypothetical protein
MSAQLDEEFRDFMHARWPVMVRLAYALAGDLGHAEAVAQTAFARAYASWPKVRRTGNPEAYVRRIVINENCNRFRKHRVLLLGPLYHLRQRADRIRALSEARRVVRCIPPRSPVSATGRSSCAANCAAPGSRSRTWSAWRGRRSCSATWPSGLMIPLRGPSCWRTPAPLSGCPNYSA